MSTLDGSSWKSLNALNAFLGRSLGSHISSLYTPCPSVSFWCGSFSSSSWYTASRFSSTGIAFSTIKGSISWKGFMLRKLRLPSFKVSSMPAAFHSFKMTSLIYDRCHKNQQPKQHVKVSGLSNAIQHQFLLMISQTLTYQKFSASAAIKFFSQWTFMHFNSLLNLMVNRIASN